MKSIVLTISMLLAAATGFSKDIKTVVFTTTPQMHCDKCEKKVKDNIRFEKGVKQIATSIPDQTVTIKYDADKTTPAKIQAGFGKFGYKARVVKPGEKIKRNLNEVCPNM